MATRPGRTLGKELIAWIESGPRDGRPQLEAATVAYELGVTRSWFSRLRTGDADLSSDRAAAYLGVLYHEYGYPAGAVIVDATTGQAWIERTNE